MSITMPAADEGTIEPAPGESASPAAPAPAAEDLDLDLEEVDGGERLKEGFTGQER